MRDIDMFLIFVFQFMGIVTFNYLTAKGKPMHIGHLKKFIPLIFKSEGRVLQSVNYIFCSDEYLLKINQEYLEHNYFTDIITFELSTPGEAVVADIFISTQRVLDNAKAFKENYQTELRRVMIHGILHLCGSRDKTNTEKKQMRKKEEFYLKKSENLFSRGTH